MSLSPIPSAAPMVRPHPRQTCFAWNAEHVDYALAPSYRAATAGRYDPELMPWWADPCNAVCDRRVNEVVVLAPTQCGKDEHLACHPLRYWVGTGAGLAVLYVGGEQNKSEELYEERIKRCLLTTPQTAAAAASAHARGLVYDIDQLTVVCTWARAGGGMKGRPFDVVLCDEVSSWPDVSKLDQARKRGATRPFFKLVIFGTPDPDVVRESKSDPLFVEFTESTAREWMMPDPAGGEFCFDVGERGDGPGLKWSPDAKRKDGTWDYAAIEATAYYRTPGGAIVTDAERWAIVKAGRWVATNERPRTAKEGYHVHQLMMPWRNVGSFGHIARRLVESIKRGPQSHRTFRYEVEARPWHGARVEIPDTVLTRAIAGKGGATYSRGKRPSAALWPAGRKVAVLTVDVQKDSQWWLIREWVQGGGCGLVDYGEARDWGKIQAECRKHGVQRAFLDGNYADRRAEVFEQAMFGAMRGAVVCFGSDRLTYDKPPRVTDPFQGTARGGRGKVLVCSWRPNPAKTLLWRLIVGADIPTEWRLCEGVEQDYLDQMQAEVYEDGAWTVKSSGTANHLWDCETMQVQAALWLGMLRFVEDPATNDAGKAIEHSASFLETVPKETPEKPAKTKGDAARDASWLADDDD